MGGRLGAFLPSIAAGLVTGLLAVVSCVSFAALIFAGELQVNLADGISLVLLSAVPVLALVALFSSYPGTIAIPQDRIAPLLALVATGIVAGLPGPEQAQERFDTVAMAIVVASLGTGVFLGLLGWLRLGGFIRFIPFPVIGGFLAGAGWLLVLGGMRVMLGDDIAPARLFVDEAYVSRWLPGVVMALGLVMVLRRVRHFMVLPLALLGGVLAFYGMLLAGGVSLDDALFMGWLLGPLPAAPALTWTVAGAFEGANWSLLAEQAPGFAAVLLVAAVSVLLNSTALEVVSGQDIKLNTELRVAGLANLASGAAGGIVGFHSFAISSLALHMGARGRALGLLAAGVCALTLLQGMHLLAYFPRFVLGGLLLFLGLGLLIDWLVDGFRRLSRGDYLVVVMILATVGAAGYLAGVAVGLVGAVILFVVNYSRIDVVKHELTGVDQRSNVDRPGADELALRTLGSSVRVLKLQGYIFFGTANRLLRRVRAFVDRNVHDEHTHVVLDFRRVTGIDSSAELSFQKLCQLAERRGFQLVFCGARGDVARQIAPAIARAGERVSEFSELDYALEWCEDRLLANAREESTTHEWDRTVTELDQLLGLGGAVPELLEYLERIEVAPGEHLIRQGDAADSLYMLESGRVSVYLETAPGERLRLRKMGAGTVTGELGIYLGGRRNASVVADVATVAWRLGEAGLSRMEKSSPHLASRFHRAMAGLLSGRLVTTNRTIRAILD